MKHQPIVVRARLGKAKPLYAPEAEGGGRATFVQDPDLKVDMRTVPRAAISHNATPPRELPAPPLPASKVDAAGETTNTPNSAEFVNQPDPATAPAAAALDLTPVHMDMLPVPEKYVSSKYRELFAALRSIEPQMAVPWPASIRPKQKLSLYKQAQTWSRRLGFKLRLHIVGEQVWLVREEEPLSQGGEP